MCQQTESRSVAFALAIAVLAAGCDTAVKQQRAEDARKAATAAALKEAGEKMHGNTKSELPSKE